MAPLTRKAGGEWELDSINSINLLLEFPGFKSGMSPDDFEANVKIKKTGLH